MSPFAHNPAAKTQSKPNPSAVPTSTQKPSVTSNTNPAPTPPAPKLAAPTVKSNPPTVPQQLYVFLNLINAWQKASPPLSHLDIPHANIRVLKYPTAEIRFFCPDPRPSAQMLLSPATAFSRLQLTGTVGVFVNAKGVNVMLKAPLPPALAGTHKVFDGVAPKDARDAIFYDPLAEPTPSPAPKRALHEGDRTRTPKDVDKRFMAHDILRALGKRHLFAADEDSVRYAKRRALEAPAPAEEVAVFVVQRPINSNESSAKTTPVASRSPTPAQRVPLFLPDNSTPLSFARPELPAPPIPRKSPDSPDFYVLIPPAPPYVVRHREKMRFQRELEAIEAAAAPEEEKEEEQEQEPETNPIDVAELRRRRSLGMKPSLLNACRGLKYTL